MSRRVIIAGNWKMHMAATETAAFVRELVPRVAEAKSAIYIAPPFTSIEAAAAAARGSQICVGAQNMSEFHKGAYTGEVSSEMLKEAGACFVIIGHSERRHIFHEDNGMIHRKVKWAIKENLEPLLCIGETQEERNRDMTKEVLHRQLEEALKEFSFEKLKKIVLAYLWLCVCVFVLCGYVCVCVYICVYVCVYVCMYVSGMCSCLYVCMNE